MPIIKEFREFFLRDTKVTSGSKPDQELNFATKYFRKGVAVFNRFLTGHFPSKQVFEKLFESITFKLNQEDTASATVQGLVKKTTDAEAYARTVNPNTDFSKAVTPHQLPEVILSLGVDDTVDSTTTVGDLTVNVVNRDLGGGLFRKIYQIVSSVSAAFSIYLKNDFSISGSAVPTLITQGLQSMSTIVTLGGVYEFEALIIVETDAVPGAKIRITGTATVSAIGFMTNAGDMNAGTIVPQVIEDLGITPILVTGAAGSTSYLLIKGSMTVSATGTFQIHASQNVSDAYASLIKKNSYFKVSPLST